MHTCLILIILIEVISRLVSLLVTVFFQEIHWVGLVIYLLALILLLSFFPLLVLFSYLTLLKLQPDAKIHYGHIFSLLDLFQFCFRCAQLDCLVDCFDVVEDFDEAVL